MLKKKTKKICREDKDIIFQLFKQLEADIKTKVMYLHASSRKYLLIKKEINFKIFFKKDCFLKKTSLNINLADGEILKNSFIVL